MTDGLGANHELSEFSRPLPPPALPSLESEFPRGVSPGTLLEQIRNTAPFLFELGSEELAPDLNDLAPFHRIILACDPEVALSHVEYFGLCVAAHFSTVATFVPTDVDNQIRFKLWHPGLDTESVLQMATLVQDAHSWDTTSVSTRWVRTPSGRMLGGHTGEWFSIAAAAYAALRKRDPEAAGEMAAMIVRELQNHAEVFLEFRAARDGVSALKAATLIAHNLGDLDRVIDLWNLPPDDPLRESVYKAGHQTVTGLDERLAKGLATAGQLNKDHMAVENHRHFALRAARALRRSADLLMPIGPFFDDWGSRVARHPALSPEEIASVAESLVEGWERLSFGSLGAAAVAASKGATATATTPVGYARALAGIIDGFPGGVRALSGYLPSRLERKLKSGLLHNQISVNRRRFEEQWNQWGLRR